MTRRVAIIGAGLTGLSAGIYLQQSGVQTEIFEISGQAGGMVAAWERQGYWFDSCIHWMVGTKQDSGFHKLYLETGALTTDTEIYNAPSILSEIDGVMLEIPMQVQAFEAFLLSLSSFAQDEKEIRALCRNVRMMAETSMPPGAPQGIGEFITMMRTGRGFLRVAAAHTGTTVGEYVCRLQSPVLRTLLCHLMPAEISLMGLIMMLGTRMGGDAGYPMGGARDVVKRMSEKYLSLGGTLHLHTRVDKIEVQEGRAAAVQAKDERYEVDAVIAACDMYDTLHNMLGGQHPHPQLELLLREAPLFAPLCIASFGLSRRFDIPYSVDYECKDEISAAGETGTPEHMDVKGFNLRSFDFDPSAAPEGHSSVMVMFDAPLDYWKNLRTADIDTYRRRKEQLAAEVIQALDRRYPGFADAVVVTDVATPATYVRYANLYKGSWEGFVPVPKLLKTSIKTTVDGVKGLRLAGQWTTPGGGLCIAVKSGKDAATQTIKYLR